MRHLLFHLLEASTNCIKYSLNSGNRYNGCLNSICRYDADVNHSPTLRKGHTAHWCLVCGIILIKNVEKPLSTADNVYVLCRHGKSKFLTAWKLSDLATSNQNLWEFSPNKLSGDLKYVHPEGGLGGENGLRSQYLLFNWL